MAAESVAKPMGGHPLFGKHFVVYQASVLNATGWRSGFFRIAQFR